MVGAIRRSQQKYHALGSDAVITLVADADIVDIDQVFDYLHDQIAAFEARFSRFLDDSELTLFNKRAGDKVEISSEFRDVLTAAKDMSTQTEGLYNPFILPVLQQLGYEGSWPNPQQGTAATDFSKGHIVTIDKLVIGDTWASIPVGSALDFGGIGKGYLLDQLANALTDEQLEGYWLSLGGDIICAGYDLDHQPWAIGIADAHDATQTIGMITNNDGDMLAIATSGIIKRRGTHAGKSWHHIIDPRTGKPSDSGILTATVSARRAVTADIYAKCIVIAGADQADIYQKNHFILSHIIQSEKSNKLKSKEHV